MDSSAGLTDLSAVVAGEFIALVAIVNNMPISDWARLTKSELI